MLVSKLAPQVDPRVKIGSAKVSRKKTRKDYTFSLKLAKSQKGNFEQPPYGVVSLVDNAPPWYGLLTPSPGLSKVSQGWWVSRSFLKLSLFFDVANLNSANSHRDGWRPVPDPRIARSQTCQQLQDGAAGREKRPHHTG